MRTNDIIPYMKPKLRLVKNNARPQKPERDLEWVLWNEPWTLPIEEVTRIMNERDMPIEQKLYIYGLFCMPGVREGDPDAMALQAILWFDPEKERQAREAMAKRCRQSFTVLAGSSAEGAP